MSWAKFDDKRALNSKLRAAGFAARGLDEAAICWSAHQEDDGKISEEDVQMLAMLHGCKKPGPLVAKLIEVGRWDVLPGGGYQIKDFLQFNRSRAELESKRQADRERKRTPRGIRAESERPPRPQPSPARPSPEQPLAAATPPRERDELFEALCQASNFDWKRMTQRERGKTNAACRQIREVGGTPQQVRQAAARWRTIYPGADVTPTGIANSWAKLTTQAPAPNGKREPTPAQRAQMAQREATGRPM